MKTYLLISFLTSAALPSLLGQTQPSVLPSAPASVGAAKLPPDQPTNPLAAAVSTGSSQPSPNTAYPPGRPGPDPSMLARYGLAPYMNSAMRYGQVIRGTADSAPAITAFGPDQDQKTMDEMGEDLDIMALVLERTLNRALGEFGEDAPEFKLGVPMLFRPDARLVKARYVEGFGAIFDLQVRFSLVPPPSTDATVEAPKTDSEWEKAKRALYGQDRADQTVAPGGDDGHYSVRLVAILKQRVLEALKNASNLRHVKPDEWVAVTVTGYPARVLVTPSVSGGVGGGFGGGGSQVLPSTGTKEGAEPPAGGGGGGGAFIGGGIGGGGGGGRVGFSAADLGVAGGGSGMGGGGGSFGRGFGMGMAAAPERPSVMTFRVKKSALNTKTLTKEQYEKSAEVRTYLGSVQSSFPVGVMGAAPSYGKR